MVAGQLPQIRPADGVGFRKFLELTIRSHHGKSAFHVNAKIQISEQRGAPGVAEVHIHEPQDGRGYRLSRRESEDVFWILLNEL